MGYKGISDGSPKSVWSSFGFAFYTSWCTMLNTVDSWGSLKPAFAQKLPSDAGASHDHSSVAKRDDDKSSVQEEPATQLATAAEPAHGSQHNRRSFAEFRRAVSSR
ncbi:unnamed protein product [Symbiodinium sp. KB8]|nr:unnamed protein product [Symbiodinium sp. KB8]